MGVDDGEDAVAERVHGDAEEAGVGREGGVGDESIDDGG